MGAETPTAVQTEAIATWLDTLPVVSGASEPDAAERGRAVFEGEAGCTDCHAGPRRTDNRTVDVGTGGAFQVPPLLGVSLRAPYFHDGCAATLAEMLDGCGDDGPHGDAGALDADQRADLLAYLRSL